MIEQSDPGARTMSRRQALKRGAVVGGALVWTVPAVQAVSMTQAHADVASAPRPGNGGGNGNGNGHRPPQAGNPPSKGGGLASTGTPVIATAAAGTGLLVTGATVAVIAAKSAATTAIAGAAGAAGAAGSGVAGAAGAAGGAGAAGAAGAAPTAIQPPPAK